MDDRAQKILKDLEENDVKFVRLFFCDMFGTPKNVAIMSDQLPHIFENGAGFDVSAVDGFMNIEESDLLLHPDPSGFAILPWRPSTGRVARLFCDIRHPDGSPFAGDGRQILQRAVKAAETLGFTFQFRSTCEFYLFEIDEWGEPTLHPQDNAGYLDIAPLDKGENIRREICLALEAMNSAPQSSHHEKGPGQNQIDGRSSGAIESADGFVTFKSVARTIASKDGIFATFMPKPLLKKSGSALSIGITLLDRLGHSTSDADSKMFMAGILRHIREITLFLNPTTNSYLRFGSFEAPKYVSWTSGNRSQLLQLKERESEPSRMELRSPDPLCNPYLAYALLIAAGMEGIREKFELMPSADFDFSGSDAGTLAKYETLPSTLKEAVDLAGNSTFVRSILSDDITEKIVRCKTEEWKQCCDAQDRQAFERTCYFSRL
jgi:glutamine synthetase